MTKEELRECYKKFNINNLVKFKFNTDYENRFCEYWSKEYGEHKTLEQLIGKPDIEGFYKMQMWMLMELFGPFINIWKTPIIDTNILINLGDLK